MQNILIILIVVIVLSYIAFSVGFYLTQEKYIFSSVKLPKDYSFSFSMPYQELFIQTKDGNLLNGLLFKTDKKSNGIILYFHGSKKNIDFWGQIAPFHTEELGYDFFMIDYRGFGKSEGRYKNQKQLQEDMQTVYDEMKKYYDESRIILMGYSLGTGIAAYLASRNQPSKLILLAPYYDYAKLIRKSYPIIINFLIKYTFRTHEFIRDCKIPIFILHGNKDDIISYEDSIALCRLLKKEDVFITLEEGGHNMIFSGKYKEELKKILGSFNSL